MAVSDSKRLLADNLASLRATHGYYQSQVAEMIGADRTTISRCENVTEEYFPNPEIIDRLAKFYQVKVSDLFREKGVAEKNFSVVATLDTALDIVTKHWADLHIARRKKPVKKVKKK